MAELSTIQALTHEWRESGIKEGDVVLLHSNIKRTFKRYLKSGVKLTPDDILQSFINAVGSYGTLLLPLFNFDFTKGIPFDINNTPSKMGVLTEAGREYQFSVRTGHPVYSFAAIGFKSEQFSNIDNISGYGYDSPFALLRKLNGKIAVLDLPDQNSMTFYHYIEEMNQVNYRYYKKFTADYINVYGDVELKTYEIFVRDIENGIVTHVNPAGSLMWKEGLYSGFKPNTGCGLRVVSAGEMYEFISQIIISGKAKNILYKSSLI